MIYPHHKQEGYLLVHKDELVWVIGHIHKEAQIMNT